MPHGAIFCAIPMESQGPIRPSHNHHNEPSQREYHLNTGIKSAWACFEHRNSPKNVWLPSTPLRAPRSEWTPPQAMTACCLWWRSWHPNCTVLFAVEFKVFKVPYSISDFSGPYQHAKQGQPHHNRLNRRFLEEVTGWCWRLTEQMTIVTSAQAGAATQVSSTLVKVIPTDL